MARGARLAVVVALFSRAAAAGADDGFFFVQMTDLHLSGGTNHIQRVSAAIDAVNALPMPVAFVLVTGDLVNNNVTDSNVVSRVKDLLSRLQPPTHLLPGNHDVVAKRWVETTNAYVRSFGPLATNFVHAGVEFLLFCDEPLYNAQLAAACADYDAFDWVDRHLRTAGDRPVILVHHRPEADDFYDNAFRPGWPEPMRQRWTTLLNRHGVRAEIVGHCHRDELQWLGAVPVYAAAPLANYYGRQASIRLYEWRDGHLSYRTIYLR